MLVNVKHANYQLFCQMVLPVRCVMSDAGYAETWLEQDDLRIMTCRLTCGYVN